VVSFTPETFFHPGKNTSAPSGLGGHESRLKIKIKIPVHRRESKKSKSKSLFLLGIEKNQNQNPCSCRESKKMDCPT
jgi:hypothetical protein